MQVVPPSSYPLPIHHEGSLILGYTTQDGPEKSPRVQQTSTPHQHELWNKTVTLSRGRTPGDPHARTVNFHCQNIEDLRTRLHDHLVSPNPEYPPEHTTVELIFPISAAFLVADPFAQSQPGPKIAQAPHTMLSIYGTPNSTVISVRDAMTPMPDPKDNMKKQRVIAKACVEAIQRVDGNRYTFHNNWWSKEDEANRFSYFCNDSILNKSRSATGGAGTIGHKVQKPVYDCKGIVTVKSAAVKQNLQVQYKHVPVHTSYEERAPPPRRGTNRYKLAEMYNPESLEKVPKPRAPKADGTGHLKRKRQTNDQTTTDSLAEDVTLESTQSLLGLTIPEADQPTTAPNSARGSRRKSAKKSKCAMCKTKKAKVNLFWLPTVLELVLTLPQCDRQEPCGNCAERPMFCTYPEETSDNAAPHEAGSEAQPPVMQSEPGSAPPDPAAGPTPRRKPGPRPKATAVATTPRQDVQKELGDAMSEFDMLKAKLAKAEERVRRLEAEKESAGLGSAAWRVKLPINYAPHTQTEWPALGIMRSAGQSTSNTIEYQPAGQDVSNSIEPRPAIQGAPKPIRRPTWQVMLPKDYASMQERRGLKIIRRLSSGLLASTTDHGNA
jgi:hypothetical protein